MPGGHKTYLFVHYANLLQNQGQKTYHLLSKCSVKWLQEKAWRSINLLICSLSESAPESSSSSGDKAYPGKRNPESWFPLKRFGERKSLGAEKSLKSRRLGDWTRFLTASNTPFSPGLQPFPFPPPGTFPVGKLGPCKNGWWTAERGWWGGKGGARPGDGLLYLKWKMDHRIALHVRHRGEKIVHLKVNFDEKLQCDLRSISKSV